MNYTKFLGSVTNIYIPSCFSYKLNRTAKYTYKIIHNLLTSTNKVHIKSENMIESMTHKLRIRLIYT